MDAIRLARHQQVVHTRGQGPHHVPRAVRPRGPVWWIPARWSETGSLDVYRLLATVNLNGEATLKGAPPEGARDREEDWRQSRSIRRTLLCP